MAPGSLDDPAWEPFLRLNGVGHMGFGFGICLPPDSNAPAFGSCMELDVAPSVACDPPQLETVRYDAARETGRWPDAAEVATPERLREFEAAWAPQGTAPYLTCGVTFDWAGMGRSMAPGSFVVELDGAMTESHSCSFGFNGMCFMTHTAEKEILFAGPGAEREVEVDFQTSLRAAGMVDTLSDRSYVVTVFASS